LKNVDITDFALAGTDPGAHIVSVSTTDGRLDQFTVVVDTGMANENGTIRLDLVDDDSIVDDAGEPLGGPGAGNGSFSGGEVYDVDHHAVKFGEDLVAFESRRSGNPFTYDLVDFGPGKTTLPNDAHVVRIAHAKALLAGDEGEFSIEWHFTDGR